MQKLCTDWTVKVTFEETGASPLEQTPRVLNKAQSNRKVFSERGIENKANPHKKLK
jgi:hypothetical protein